MFDSKAARIIPDPQFWAAFFLAKPARDRAAGGQPIAPIASKLICHL